MPLASWSSLMRHWPVLRFQPELAHSRPAGYRGPFQPELTRRSRPSQLRTFKSCRDPEVREAPELVRVALHDVVPEGRV
eukprot:15112834-Alexandrium_andersonii.AAC.1